MLLILTAVALAATTACAYWVRTRRHDKRVAASMVARCIGADQADLAEAARTGYLWPAWQNVDEWDQMAGNICGAALSREWWQNNDAKEALVSRVKSDGGIHTDQAHDLFNRMEALRMRLAPLANTAGRFQEAPMTWPACVQEHIRGRETATGSA